MRVKFTIAKKGLILISVPFAFQVAFSWLIAEMQWSNAETQAWSSHSKEVLTQAQAVSGKLVDAETGIRGFAATGNPIFTQPYKQAIQELPDTLRELQALVSDNPSQEARARLIADKAQLLMATHAEDERLIRGGARDRAVARMEAGKRQMDDLRQEIGAFLSEEKRLDETRDLALQQSRQRLNGLLLAGGVVSLLSTLALALVFSRSITPCPVNEVPLVRAMRGEAVDQAEFFVRHASMPEGTWLSITARPLKDQAGVVRGGVVVFRDISDRKRAEEAIRRANEELEARVLERTAELADTNRQLTQKNQENEMFVYSVSHDLRSPLVNLEGFSKELSMVCQDLRSLLEEDHLPPAVRDRGLSLLDSDMAEAIRFIQTGVERLSSIIDALLRLSRAGRVEYQSQHVEAKAVVARIVDSMRATIAERGATITVADLPPVWADPVAVEQIFANLIGNALNYLNPNRPGVIEVGSDHAAVPAEGQGSLALQTYYVKDNGLGIPEAYQPKVFQAFQRLHPNVAKGEGIGLALVRRIVERHGGRIWLESSEGVGSTFWVTLPVPRVNGTGNGFKPHEGSTKEWEDATWQHSSSSFS